MKGNIAHSDFQAKDNRREMRLGFVAHRVYERGMKHRLKEIRLSKKLTQRQVADRAGMSVSYYTELEQGKKQLNANRLDGIARALGCSIHDLIYDDKAGEIAALRAVMEKLSPENRQLVLKMAQSLSAQEGK